MASDLISFHGDVRLKAQALKDLVAARKAGLIVQAGDEPGSGGAVRCLMSTSSRHLFTQFAKRFGIPAALACLEDCIFENLPGGDALDWPHEFMSACRPGANLALAEWKFQSQVLTDIRFLPGKFDPRVAAAHEMTVQVVKSLADGAVPSSQLANALAAEKSATRAKLEFDKKGLEMMVAAKTAAWATYGVAEAAADAARQKLPTAGAPEALAASSVYISSTLLATKVAESVSPGEPRNEAWRRMAQLLIRLVK